MQIVGFKRGSENGHEVATLSSGSHSDLNTGPMTIPC